MPYKDPKQQRQAQIIIQRRYRKREKEKKELLALLIPDVYTLVFGKPPPRRKAVKK